MKKIRKYTLILLYLLVPLMSGYVIPDGAPYVKVNCSLGNNIYIYFSRNQLENLQINETQNKIINIGSSTIYGYTTNTRISFPVYDEPTYNTGYNSVNLSISDILEVHIYTTATDFLKKDIAFYTFVVLGGIMVWLMFHTKL